MLKFTVLALFVVSATCVDVIEVSGDKVVKTADRSLPLKTISGFSSVNGLNSFPVGQTVVSGVNPALSTYGVSGLSGISGISGIGGLSNVHHNLNYLRDLRSRVFGSSVNIAPSAYSYLPFGQSQSYFGVNGLNYGQNLGLNYGQNLGLNYGQSYLGIRQPQSFGISYAQPAISVAQPAISVAQPVAQHLSIAQPQVSVVNQGIAVARPQVYAAQHQSVHPVTAAITQVGRTVEYRPIPFQDQPIVPQDVIVEPSDQPINIHFRSRSSTVRITQDHIPGEPGEVVQTNSQDEPSRVQHEVVKPVVQEVREVIQPYRQVTQEINPVVENVHTVVTHGEGQRQQYVAEPIRQQVLTAVRPAVQQLAVQQLAVPAVRQVVQAPAHYVAVAQPAIQQVARHVGTIAVAQPHVQTVVPQIQTLSVQPQVQVAQPYLSSYFAQPSYGSIGYGGYGAVRSFGIAQPAVGVSRVVVARQPDAVVRQEVREVRPVEVREGVQSGNFVRYHDTN